MSKKDAKTSPEAERDVCLERVLSDVQILRQERGFNISDGALYGGRIIIGPTTTIYPEKALQVAELEKRSECAYYSRKLDMTLYFFMGETKKGTGYQLIEYAEGDKEQERQKNTDGKK